MANEIKLTGFKEFQGKLNKLPAGIQVEAEAIVEDEARRWEGLAKRTAPKNFGLLAGQISANKVATMTWDIASPVFYSPYVEWGTGTRRKIPSDLAKYAYQFKGIKEVIGMTPQPFFFIHKPTIEKELISRLTKVLNTPH